MINLSLIIIIPGIVSGIILFILDNYTLKYITKVEDNVNIIPLIEEKHIMYSSIIEKYYLSIRNKVDNIYHPIKKSSTYWYNIIKDIKEQLEHGSEEEVTDLIKKIGLFLSLIVFLILILIWFDILPITASYQNLTSMGLDSITSNINMILGVDGVSLPFVLLIGYVLPIVYLSSWSTIDYAEANYILMIVLLELFLLIVFLVIDLVMFYVFFESILPPLFLLIGLYGASQKFRAGYYLFLYTLFGSLFMLLSFVKVGGDSGGTFFDGLTNDNFYQIFQELLWLILFLSFSVKTPLIPVHIWLPLAHSDANVSGSILLASIVLKLALYGFIRILISILTSGTSKLTPIFLALCCISVLYASSTTIRQFDLKVIVAYSSIAHMASSLLGTFSDTVTGIVGSVIFGVAHGFVSPGLFLLVGSVIYERAGSRIINYFRGLTDLAPLFSFIFLLFIFGNMGVPLTGNFVGEFLSLLGAYQQNIFIASIGATSIILSAIYSIFTYNRVTSGTYSPHLFTIPDMYRKEYYIILPLLVLTIILGIYPSFITSDIEFALSHCLLFSFFPPVLLRKDGNNPHKTVSNPHNTPVVEPTVPTTSSGRSRYPNRTPESDRVGNPQSEEGYSHYVGPDDERNQAVNPEDLHRRIINTIYPNGTERRLDMERDQDTQIERSRRLLRVRDENTESTEAGPSTSSSPNLNDLNNPNFDANNNESQDKGKGKEVYDSSEESDLGCSSSSLSSVTSKNYKEYHAKFRRDIYGSSEEGDPGCSSSSIRRGSLDKSDESQDKGKEVARDKYDSNEEGDPGCSSSSIRRRSVENNDDSQDKGKEVTRYKYDSSEESDLGCSSSSLSSVDSKNYKEYYARFRRESVENNNETNVNENNNSTNVSQSNSNPTVTQSNNDPNISQNNNNSNISQSNNNPNVSQNNNNNPHINENYNTNVNENNNNSGSQNNNNTNINRNNNNNTSLNENNSNTNLNKNNNIENIYTLSQSDSLNNLPDGHFIFVSDYYILISNFIKNFSLTIPSLTPISLLILIIAFFSYYRYFILCISFKDSIIQCYLILKYWKK